MTHFFLNNFFKDSVITFPINPFSILKKLGIPYLFRSLDKLDGLIFSDSNLDDDVFVVINSNRVVQRIRFSCAHELCHYLKDIGNPAYNPLKCFASSKTQIERYAESFAASLLMPRGELKRVISKQISKSYLSTDNILQIADYFGVSFTSCYYRIRQVFPESLPYDIEAQVNKYHPNVRRLDLGFSDISLYEQILNSWDYAWNNSFNSRASYIFKNDYVFNDARLEGLSISLEDVAEILTDIRINKQSSKYCSPQYSNFTEVAGHSAIYDFIFNFPKEEKLNIYIVLQLNRILFSCTPYPEFGGRTRVQNTMVIGAKFNTLDYQDVMKELIKLDETIQFLEAHYLELNKSEIVKQIVIVHH